MPRRSLPSAPKRQRRLRSACASRRAPTRGRGSGAAEKASSRRRPAAPDQHHDVPIWSALLRLAAGRSRWRRDCYCVLVARCLYARCHGLGRRGILGDLQRLPDRWCWLTPTWLVEEGGGGLPGWQEGRSHLTGGRRRSHLATGEGVRLRVSVPPRIPSYPSAGNSGAVAFCWRRGIAAPDTVNAMSFASWRLLMCLTVGRAPAAHRRA